MTSFRLRQSEIEDNGSALILVLIITALLITTSTIGLTVSSNSVSESANYTNTSQAELAAIAGINEALSQINSASSSSNYPCATAGSLGNSGNTSTYQISVAYFSSSGSTTAENCSGRSGANTTLGTSSPSPVRAVVTANGDSSSSTVSQAAVMKADFIISSMPASLMQYAIFTNGTFTATNSNSLSPATNGLLPNIFAQNIVCNGHVSNAANVFINGPASLGNCTIGGNMVAMGSLTLGKSGTSIIDGNAASFNGGSSGIYIAGSSYIKGDAGAYEGSIQLYGGSSSGSIGGSATATGPIGSTTEGDVYAASAANNYVNGVTYVSNSANYPSWGSETNWFKGGVNHQPTEGIAPTIPDFPLPPQISSTQSIINIPSGTAGPTSSCSSFFTNSATTQNTFLYDMANWTSSSLIIDAPTCSVASGVLSSNVNLDTNLTLEVASFTADGGNGGGTLSIQPASTLAPGASEPLSFSVLAGVATPYTTNDGCSGFGNTGNTITLAGTGTLTVSPNIGLFIYTPGSVSYGNQTTITGQIFACSGITQGGGDFNMTFSPVKNSALVWTEASGAAITDEYLVEG